MFKGNSRIVKDLLLNLRETYKGMLTVLCDMKALFYQENVIRSLDIITESQKVPQVHCSAWC